MTTCRIAVLAGGGIGPEVVNESFKVRQTVETKLHEVRFTFEHGSFGAGECLKNGDPPPASALERVQACDAIPLGAMGLPSVRWPSGVEMTPQIDVREKPDLYYGVRPIKLHRETHSPFKGYGGAGGKPVDFVVIRENCEGLFSEWLTSRPAGRDHETDTMKITRRGAERVCREAFKLSCSRRQCCTLVDKANVFPSMAVLRKIVDEVAAIFFRTCGPTAFKSMRWRSSPCDARTLSM